MSNQRIISKKTSCWGGGKSRSRDTLRTGARLSRSIKNGTLGKSGRIPLVSRRGGKAIDKVKIPYEGRRRENKTK